MINREPEDNIFQCALQNSLYKWARGFLLRDHISHYSIPEEHFFQAISPIHNLNGIRVCANPNWAKKKENIEINKTMCQIMYKWILKKTEYLRPVWQAYVCYFFKFQSTVSRIAMQMPPAHHFFQLPFFRNVLRTVV